VAIRRVSAITASATTTVTPEMKRKVPRLALGDADLDTGRPPSLGANPLADETSVKYKEKLTTSH
jgi:hypothetical protein